MGYPVYLNGHFPSAAETAASKDTLSVLIAEFRKSGKSDAQIYSILMGMGIAPEKAANGIQGITKEPTPEEVAMQTAARTFLQVISVEEKDNTQTKNINMKFPIENLIKKIQETMQSVTELDAANSGKYGFSVKKIKENLDASLVALDVDKAQDLLKSIDNTNKSLEDFLKKPNAAAELDKLKKQAMSITERKHILETISVLRQKLHEHAWIESVKDLCLHIDELKVQNRMSMYLMEALYNMKNDKFNAFNKKSVEVVEKMIEEGEEHIKNNYNSLKEFAWSVPVRNAIGKIATTLNEMKDSQAGATNKVFSPVQVNEDESVTVAISGKFYAISENGIAEVNESQKPTPRFLKTLDALSMFSIVSEATAPFAGTVFNYYGKRNTLSINEGKAYVGSTVLEKVTPEAIMFALQENTLTSSDAAVKAEKIAFLMESLDTVKEIDIFTSITSRQRQGVAVNIAKMNENIFVNRINAAMGCNEMIQVKSAKVAQELVNEFVNFDITPLVQEMLTSEEKQMADLQEKKNSLQEGLKIFETKKKEILAIQALNPEAMQVQEAFEIVSSEIEKNEKELQAVYHQISELSEKKN
jgi:hypothetical protein